MGTRPAALIAAVLILAGAGTLVWGRVTAGDVRRTVGVEEPFLAQAYTRAAQASFGRRVLVLHARPLDPVQGEILEAAEAADGWGLYSDLPRGADDLGAVLERLAMRAAGEWDADREFSGDTIDGLAHLGVALILIEDGARIVTARKAADQLGLSPETSVPALRVRGAEIVYRCLSGGGLEPASILDPSDLLFGGRVVVDVAEPGEFVFVWPAGGARVTLDGEPATGRGDESGRLVLDLPPGRVTVRAVYGEESPRVLVLTAAVAALVAGGVVLLRTFRPRLEHDGGATAEGAPGESA